MKALEITRKDLLLQVRDIRALTILVVVPLIFIAILGATFGKLLGWKAQNQVLRIAVVENYDLKTIKGDSDTDERTRTIELDENQKRRNARQLVVNLMNSLQKRKGIRVDLKTEEQAEQELKEEDVETILVIGPTFYDRVDSLELRDILDFSEGKLKGGLPDLDMEVRQREGSEGTGSVVEQMVFADTVRNIAAYVTCRNGSAPRLQIRERCERDWEKQYVAGDPMPVPDEPEPIEQEGVDKSSAVYDRVVPGLTVMFVFFLVNIMARSFIHERELGTLKRLEMAPIGTPSLLLGKTIPFLLTSLVQSVVLFGCGKLLFGMSFGPHPWLMVPVAFCTSLAATGLGLMLATLVKTDSQVSAYSNLVVITMAGISGCLVPRDMLPYRMLQISLATPHAWAVEAFRQLLPEHAKTPNLQIVGLSCAMLIAFSAGFFLIGVMRFSASRTR